MIKKINPAQKRIVLISTAAILTFFIFWFLLYTPIKGGVGRLKKDLTDIDSQIKQIEKVVDRHRTIDEEMKSLEERYAQISSKFPSKEEEALGMLSDFARKLDLSVLSVRSQPKMPFVDADKQKAEIDGKTCQKFLVTLEIKGSYKDFLAYLETIKELLPAYLTVERLQISKDLSGSPGLNINVDFNLYLLS